MSTADIITLQNVGHYSNGSLIIGYRVPVEHTHGNICVEFTAGEQDVQVKLEANFTVEQKVTDDHVLRIVGWLEICTKAHMDRAQLGAIQSMLVHGLPTMCL